MSFWKNESWERLEKNATGDVLRGLPKKDFPQLLKSLEHKDKEGDQWSFVVHCLAMEPAKDGKKVLATLRLSSEVRISKLNLNKMGFSAERLGNLLDNEVSKITFNLEKIIEAEAEIIEKIASKWLEAEKARNELKWTFNAKQKQIWTNLKSRPFSRFADT